MKYEILQEAPSPEEGETTQLWLESRPMGQVTLMAKKKGSKGTYCIAIIHPLLYLYA